MMNLGRLLAQSIATVGALLLATPGIADITITVNGGTGGVGNTINVTHDYEALDADDVGGYQFDIQFDASALTVSDLTQCVDGAPATHGSSFCAEPSSGTVRVVIADGAPPTDEIMPTTIVPMGTIVFTIEEAGDHTLQFTGAVGSDIDGNNVAISGNDATVTGEFVNAAGYASNPDPNSTINLGESTVGTASNASPSNVTVSEIGDQQLDVQAPAFSGTNPGDFSSTTGAFSIVDGGAPVDVDFSCTPTAEGTRTATVELTNNSGNEANAQYTLTCTGLVPNVTAPTMATIDGTIGQSPAPTGSFDVTNPDTGTTSDAQNVTLTVATDAPEITIDNRLEDNVISVDETDTVTLSCGSTDSGTFTEVLRLSYDDPEGGTATQDVTVECNIANVAPGYTSDPAVGSTLTFNQVVNGDTSAAQTIAIGNENSVGSGAQAELEITGAVLSDSTNYSFSPDPFTATLAAQDPNGTASIDVSCTPQSIGDFSGATLTVQTNDGDQVYNLSCEGTSNAQLQASPGSAIDGRLSIGTVAPGTTATRSLTLSNAGTDPLDISCTLTDNNAGVIGFATAPSFPVTVPPDASLDFEGTPGEIATFEETLDCTVTDPSNGNTDQSFSTVVAVTGRPLVVPTMSSWGLIVMSLMMLLVGGFAGRRMMG